MATATAGELVETSRSHWIALDWRSGRREITSEELYPIVRVGWNGADLQVRVHARRYLSSSGWTDWHTVATDEARRHDADAEHWHELERVPMSDVARSKISAVCRPVVLEWLESDEYPAARRRAVAYAIRRELRDERTGTDRLQDTLENLASEISEDELDNLQRAVYALHELLERTHGIPAE